MSDTKTTTALSEAEVTARLELARDTLAVGERIMEIVCAFVTVQRTHVDQLIADRREAA